MMLLLTFLLGCGQAIDGGGGQSAAPAPVAPRAAPKAADDGAAKEQWFYNPAGKRDPFASFMARQSATQVSADAPPLQRWDTDKFGLTGVIWSVEVPRALLVDPEGIGHVVRLGTYVGRNWGKVTAISEDGIVVTEEYRTLDGELVVNPVSIRFGGVRKKQ